MKEKSNKIMQLSPHVEIKIWGGEKLAKWREIGGAEPIGETWEVSRLDSGPSHYNGESLKEIFTEDELPYLVKYIDTSDNLSVQVHPDNSYAKEFENSQGKTECWLILEAEKGAGIYLGLKDGVSEEDLKRSIEGSEKVNELLNFYEVKAGEFYLVPAKTIHAIGSGVTLVEIQQSCGITYRVWDWNRLDSEGNSRELHVKKALDVIEFDPEKNKKKYFAYKSDLFSKESSDLCRHSDFSVKLLNINDGARKNINISEESRVSSLTCLSGSFEVKFAGESHLVDEKNSVVLNDFVEREFEIVSGENGCSLIFVD